MPPFSEARPPGACSWLIRIASRLVPLEARPEWLAVWYSDLHNWWILHQRGTVPMNTWSFCHAALSSAFALRLESLHLTRTIRSPGFVLATAALVFLLLVLLTGGFPVTRSLLQDALWPTGKPQFLHENRVTVYAIPLMLALSSAIALISIGPMPVRARGVRCWLFLFAKTFALLLIVPLLWIEGGASLRSAIPHIGLRMFGAGLGLALVFIAVFAYALEWSFLDQRQRCPVCLRRLTLPVSLGTCGSIFDPSITELLCEDGHGALAVTETLTGERGQWTELDASWRGF